MAWPASANATPPASLPVSATLAYADGDRVCVAPFTDKVGDKAGDRADDKALGAPACTPVLGTPAALVWRDSSSLVVLLDHSRVGILADGRFSLLALPQKKVWKVARPKHDNMPVAAGSEVKLVVTGVGEIWLGHCGWVSQLDEPACLAWVYARLDGAAAVRHDEPDAKLTPYGPATQPAGVQVTIDAGDGSAPTPTLRCARDGGTSTFTPPAHEGAIARADVVWLAPASMLYLVVVAYDYMETIRREVYLAEACATAGPEALGDRASDEDGLVWGPPGTLVYRTDAGWVVRAGKRMLVTLPDSDATPAFRP